MAFGKGQGASSPAPASLATSVGPTSGAWGDSQTRVVTVIVLGGGLILINASRTNLGATFVAKAWNLGPISSGWVTTGTTVGSLLMQGAFLGTLIVIAAISEEGASLVTALLAALWFAWLLRTFGAPLTAPQAGGNRTAAAPHEAHPGSHIA